MSAVKNGRRKWGQQTKTLNFPHSQVKIHVIIVAYNPDKENIQTLVETLCFAGCNPIIVDNSDIKMPNVRINRSPQCITISLGENRGIAEAQNIGIRAAIGDGTDVIGFFDQDSRIGTDLLFGLIDTIKKDDIDICAPVSIDADTGDEYPSQKINKLGLPKDIINVDKNHKVIEADIVISSGTFVKKTVFDKAGMFDESFFIDFVDIEWCLRCRKNNIKIIVNRDVKMLHSIGENLHKICFLTVNVHTPYRTYYKVRNSILLLFRGISPVFALSQIVPAIIQNFVLIFDKSRGKEYRKYYFHAIFDGIRNRGGKYEEWHEGQDVQ